MPSILKRSMCHKAKLSLVCSDWQQHDHSRLQCFERGIQVSVNCPVRLFFIVVVVVHS